MSNEPVIAGYLAQILVAVVTGLVAHFGGHLDDQTSLAVSGLCGAVSAALIAGLVRARVTPVSKSPVAAQTPQKGN